MGNIVNRSLIAGIVSQQELGSVYGLLAMMDAALPFIGNSLIIYAHLKLRMDTICQDNLPQKVIFKAIK